MTDDRVRFFKRRYVLAREVGEKCVLFATGEKYDLWTADVLLAKPFDEFIAARDEQKRLQETQRCSVFVAAVSFDFVRYSE